eukprot:Tbor_TRINITY_DN6078_c0_g1::TRINITY_DN6078_c0_g1_i8::g.10276::m.10276
MEGSSLASGTTVPSMEAVSQSTTPCFSSQFMHYTSNLPDHAAPIVCVDSTSNPHLPASAPGVLLNGEQPQHVYQQDHQQEIIDQLPQDSEMVSKEKVEDNTLMRGTDSCIFTIGGGSDTSRTSTPLMTFQTSVKNSPLLSNYSNFGSFNGMDYSLNFPGSGFLPDVDWGNLTFPSDVCVDRLPQQSVSPSRVGICPQLIHQFDPLNPGTPPPEFTLSPKVVNTQSILS